MLFDALIFLRLNLCRIVFASPAVQHEKAPTARVGCLDTVLRCFLPVVVQQAVLSPALSFRLAD